MSRAKSLAALGDNAANLENAIANVADDSTPQLGANLDVNSHSIVSTSNGNIPITPNGSGKVILDGLSWPTADGSSDQVLKTDGGGNLSFTTVSSGGSTGDISFSGSTITSSGSTVTIDDELYVSGKIGVGNSSPECGLFVAGSSTSTLSNTDPLWNTDRDSFIKLENESETSGVETGIILRAKQTSAGVWAIYSKHTGNYQSDLIFRGRTGSSASAELFKLGADGTVGFGGSMNFDGAQNYMITNISANWGHYLRNDGNSSNRYGLEISCGQDNATYTNYAIAIADGNGGDQGYITFNNGTVTYGAFSAYHEVSVPDSDNPTDIDENAYPYGTLVETTSIYYKQKNGSNTERGIRYNVQKAATKYSRKVLGAYCGTMNNGPDTKESDNLHQVGVLGDGHIICNNEGGNILIGDGICVSSSVGIGMKADKMCMCIGIAQEDITFSGSETKLVAVQFNLQQFTPWTD